MNTASRKPVSVSSENATPAEAEIRAHHLLDAHRQGDLAVVEAAVDAVRDGSVGKQRRIAQLAGVQQSAVAAHIQVGLLLAGEARVGQILGGRAAAHGHVQVAAHARTEPVVGLDDGPLQIVGEFGGRDRVADLLAAASQLGDVLGVQPLEQLGDALVEAGLLQEVPVSLRGHREPRRDVHPPRHQLAVHLAERGVLAADFRDVFDTDFFEPSNVLVHGVSGVQGSGGLGFGSPQRSQRSQRSVINVFLCALCVLCGEFIVVCRRAGLRSRR